MSSARITIPYPEEGAELLVKESKAQNRTFSGYMQNVITNYIKEKKEEKDGSDVE